MRLVRGGEGLASSEVDVVVVVFIDVVAAVVYCGSNTTTKLVMNGRTSQIYI